MSDGEFNPDDIQLMQTNYNGYVTGSIFQKFYFNIKTKNR